MNHYAIVGALLAGWPVVFTYLFLVCRFQHLKYVGLKPYKAAWHFMTWRSLLELYKNDT